jgi:hypothetical protein
LGAPECPQRIEFSSGRGGPEPARGQQIVGTFKNSGTGSTFRGSWHQREEEFITTSVYQRPPVSRREGECPAVEKAPPNLSFITQSRVAFRLKQFRILLEQKNQTAAKKSGPLATFPNCAQNNWPFLAMANCSRPCFADNCKLSARPD